MIDMTSFESSHEGRRRRRVVHGWAFMDLDEVTIKHIRDYIEGRRDDPPTRWAQVDRSCK